MKNTNFISSNWLQTCLYVVGSVARTTKMVDMLLQTRLSHECHGILPIINASEVNARLNQFTFKTRSHPCTLSDCGATQHISDITKVYLKNVCWEPASRLSYQRDVILRCSIVYDLLRHCSRQLRNVTISNKNERYCVSIHIFIVNAIRNYIQPRLRDFLIQIRNAPI